LFTQVCNEMYSNVNGFTVSGKNRFFIGSDSPNIIMVRLNKT